MPLANVSLWLLVRIWLHLDKLCTLFTDRDTKGTSHDSCDGDGPCADGNMEQLRSQVDRMRSRLRALWQTAQRSRCVEGNDWSGSKRVWFQNKSNTRLL